MPKPPGKSGAAPTTPSASSGGTTTQTRQPTSKTETKPKDSKTKPPKESKEPKDKKDQKEKKEKEPKAKEQKEQKPKEQAAKEGGGGKAMPTGPAGGMGVPTGGSGGLPLGGSGDGGPAPDFTQQGMDQAQAMQNQQQQTPGAVSQSQQTMPYQAPTPDEQADITDTQVPTRTVFLPDQPQQPFVYQATGPIPYAPLPLTPLAPLPTLPQRPQIRPAVMRPTEQLPLTPQTLSLIKELADKRAIEDGFSIDPAMRQLYQSQTKDMQRTFLRGSQQRAQEAMQIVELMRPVWPQQTDNTAFAILNPPTPDGQNQYWTAVLGRATALMVVGEPRMATEMRRRFVNDYFAYHPRVHQISAAIDRVAQSPEAWSRKAYVRDMAQALVAPL